MGMNYESEVITSVTVTPTPTPDADVLDRVKVLKE
jgi:hypothetical protein